MSSPIYVPPQRTVFDLPQAAYAYWHACLALGIEPTVPLVSILMGHGRLETGNFVDGCWCYGVGNIKPGSAWTGLYTCYRLNEIETRNGKNVEIWYSPEGELASKAPGASIVGERWPAPPTPGKDGKVGHPQTRMRAFESLAAGVADKIRFLAGERWASVLEFAKRGDASGYVRAIRAKGYFTAYKGVPLDQVTPYETSVISLAAASRPLVLQVQQGLVVPTAPQSVTPVAEAVRTNLLDTETVARIVTRNAAFIDDLLDFKVSDLRDHEAEKNA